MRSVAGHPSGPDPGLGRLLDALHRLEATVATLQEKSQRYADIINHTAQRTHSFGDAAQAATRMFLPHAGAFERLGKLVGSFVMDLDKLKGVQTVLTSNLQSTSQSLSKFNDHVKRGSREAFQGSVDSTRRSRRQSAFEGHAYTYSDTTGHSRFGGHMTSGGGGGGGGRTRHWTGASYSVDERWGLHKRAGEDRSRDRERAHMDTVSRGRGRQESVGLGRRAEEDTRRMNQTMSQTARTLPSLAYGLNMVLPLVGAGMDLFTGAVHSYVQMINLVANAMQKAVQSGAPHTWNTFSKSLDLVFASVGKDLIPFFVEMARHAQHLAREWQRLSPETRQFLVQAMLLVSGIRFLTETLKVFGDVVLGIGRAVERSGSQRGLTPDQQKHILGTRVEKAGNVSTKLGLAGLLVPAAFTHAMGALIVGEVMKRTGQSMQQPDQGPLKTSTLTYQPAFNTLDQTYRQAQLAALRSTSDDLETEIRQVQLQSLGQLISIRDNTQIIANKPPFGK